MRNLFLGICCAALIGPLAAQEPVKTTPAKSNIQQVSGILGGACHDNCCNKVCVSEPTTKKHSRTVFSSKCIEYCLPNCRLGGGCCSDSCSDNCGPVRVKHVLMKKVVTEECPSTHCVVREGPACVTTVPAVTAPAVKDGGKK